MGGRVDGVGGSTPRVDGPGGVVRRSAPRVTTDEVGPALEGDGRGRHGVLVAPRTGQVATPCTAGGLVCP